MVIFSINGVEIQKFLHGDGPLTIKMKEDEIPLVRTKWKGIGRLCLVKSTKRVP